MQNIYNPQYTGPKSTSDSYTGVVSRLSWASFIPHLNKIFEVKGDEVIRNVVVDSYGVQVFFESRFRK